MVLTLADLAEDDTGDLPPLDRTAPGSDAPFFTRLWHQDGYLILRGLIPDEPIDAYCDRFELDADNRAADPARSRGEIAAGYGIGTPYLSNARLRDVAMHRDLTPILTALFGAPLGLHLNLTGWTSTLRDWHVDRYLNPPCVGDWYAATWIALGDVDAGNGPFEFVPGSHRWPRITRAKMLAALGESGDDPDWPRRSELLLTPMYENEFAERDATVEQFHAKKGDVLIWHPNLVHRGSPPAEPDRERRALISHWSVVSRRMMCDMPRTRTYASDHADGIMFELGKVSD